MEPVTEKSRGDCNYCGRPVYSNADPMACNALFKQDPYGPEDQGTWYHMTCWRRHLDEKRAETAPKAELRSLLLPLLVGSLILNVVLVLKVVL